MVPFLSKYSVPPPSQARSAINEYIINHFISTREAISIRNQALVINVFFLALELYFICRNKAKDLCINNSDGLVTKMISPLSEMRFSAPRFRPMEYGLSAQEPELAE